MPREETTYMMAYGFCANCRVPIQYAPTRVPSLRIDGEKRAICRTCFGTWNMIHRTSKGLEAMPVPEGAYEPEPAGGM